MKRIDYLKRHRRLLVDMHIPDWEPKLLSLYDPQTAVDLWHRAGVNAVMFFCQSHVGLCYWPTRTGKMHAGLKGRDIVGETLELLHKRDIAACGYYSVIYNNWAFLEHPDWRIVPSKFSCETDLEAAFKKHTGRYGTCCPNHPDYRQFCLAQIKELAGTYAFDAFFFDMTFWPVTACICPRCRQRFRDEAGLDIPETVDWLDPKWCAFQAARERWMTEFTAFLSRAVKDAAGADIPVYHNSSPVLGYFHRGVPFEAVAQHDFLGGDFYCECSWLGVMICKLLQNLTRRRPLELMTSRCETYSEHERTKSLDEMRASAFAALHESGAILFIDAVDPEGTFNPAFYERLRVLYEELAPYEPWLGGDPVEEIGVYFSSDSRMDFRQNGTPPAQVAGNQPPHSHAMEGICRVLSRAHLPFGVITRKQLPDLGRYRVLILPDVLRMDREEAEAFRAYVRNGGKLFATRYTSLTETNGTRGGDFLLADVFGCHYAGDDLGAATYLKFSDPVLRECIVPQRYLSHRVPAEMGMLRLRPKTEGEILAFLVRPYSTEPGTVFNQKWISIHMSPPWEETDIPALVRHGYGKGECIYSAADLECVRSEANERLLVHLIRGLLGDRPAWGADAHPCVRMSVFHQADQKRFRVSLLNSQEQMPVVPIRNICFHLRPPEGRRFVKLVRIPDQKEIPFTVDQAGCLRTAVPHLDLFTMIAAEYA